MRSIGMQEPVACLLFSAVFLLKHISTLEVLKGIGGRVLGWMTFKNEEQYV